MNHTTKEVVQFITAFVMVGIVLIVVIIYATDSANKNAVKSENVTTIAINKCTTDLCVTAIMLGN